MGDGQWFMVDGFCDLIDPLVARGDPKLA